MKSLFTAFLLMPIVAWPTFASAEQGQITLFCNTVYKSCENDSCYPTSVSWLFGWQNWGKTVATEYFISDKVFSISGVRYPVIEVGDTIPTIGHTMYAEVDRSVGAIMINIYRVSCYANDDSGLSVVQLADGRKCKKEILNEIFIDRYSGFLTNASIHTDGSIPNIPVGKPYSYQYGYCDKKINRKF